MHFYVTQLSDKDEMVFRVDNVLKNDGQCYNFVVKDNIKIPYLNF